MDDEIIKEIWGGDEEIEDPIIELKEYMKRAMDYLKKDELIAYDLYYVKGRTKKEVREFFIKVYNKPKNTKKLLRKIRDKLKVLIRYLQFRDRNPFVLDEILEIKIDKFLMGNLYFRDMLIKELSNSKEGKHIIDFIVAYPISRWHTLACLVWIRAIFFCFLSLYYMHRVIP